MRKVGILLLVMIVSLVILADNYKILQINTPYVKIGKRNCSKGDVFSDKSVIYWGQKKQAFKAQNLKTKEIKLFVESDFSAKGCKTIKDYYLKTNHLSSRGSESSALDEISDTIYLCDSAILDIPVEIDSTHYCYIVYNNENESVQKCLKNKEQSFIIDKYLFDEKSIEKDIQLRLFYHTPEEEFLLKDSLTIVFIPWE